MSPEGQRAGLDKDCAETAQVDPVDSEVKDGKALGQEKGTRVRPEDGRTSSSAGAIVKSAFQRYGAIGELEWWIPQSRAILNRRHTLT